MEKKIGKMKKNRKKKDQFVTEYSTDLCETTHLFSRLELDGEHDKVTLDILLREWFPGVTTTEKNEEEKEKWYFLGI